MYTRLQGWTTTDATNTDSLLGHGVSGGIGVGKCGIELIGLNPDDNGIDGFKIGVGPGAGMDIHYAELYTKEIGKLNVYDILLWVIEGSMYEHRILHNDGSLGAD